jgi:high-affinity iron transporter
LITFKGISKLIATVFILQFSLKIPVWLGVYEKVPLCGLKKMIKVYCCHKKEVTAETEEKENLKTLSLAEIRFNVMWNLWREVTECGVYMIPFILGSNAKAIPLSGLVGLFIALLLTTGIYQANQHMKNKFWVAVFMAGLMLMLSVGLLVGAASEFQSLAADSGDDDSGSSEDAGNGPYVYQVRNEFWADDRFPLVLLKPFGYSDKRTVVQMCCFWVFLAFGLSCHYVMYYRSKQVRALRQQESGKVLNESDEEAQDTFVDTEAGETPVESVVEKVPSSRTMKDAL